MDEHWARCFGRDPGRQLEQQQAAAAASGTADSSTLASLGLDNIEVAESTLLKQSFGHLQPSGGSNADDGGCWPAECTHAGRPMPCSYGWERKVTGCNTFSLLLASWWAFAWWISRADHRRRV